MASEESNVTAESKVEAKPAEAPQEKDNKTAEETLTAVSEENKKTEEAPPAPAPAPPKPTVHKSNYEKDVVYLYQFSRTPALPSLSAYCLKVETWLRLAGVKYENVDHKMKFRSKKGQLPFVELNGEEIADSSIIMKELAQRFEKDLDKDLSNSEKNLAHALISMIENNLLWVVMWWRTKYPENFIRGYKLNLQHHLGTKIPNGILSFFFKLTYGRKGSRKVKAQGIGVHKPEEIGEIGRNDLKVLSETLGDKPFFFGDEPTSLDVVAFANLAQVHFIDKEVQYELRDYMVENCPNLIGHVNRMKERCFPDWDEMCKNLDMNSHLPKPPPEEKTEKEKEAKEEKNEKEGDKENDKDKDVEKDKEIEKAEKEDKGEKEVEENKATEEKETAK